MIDIIDDTDNIDPYSVTFVRDSQSHNSQSQHHKFITRRPNIADAVWTWTHPHAAIGLR